MSSPPFVDYIDAVRDFYIRESQTGSSAQMDALTQLASLAQDDQRERSAYAAFVRNQMDGNWDAASRAWATQKGRSPQDIFGDHDRLQRFMTMTFEFSMFKPVDWEHYWILAQHADRYRAFQKQALEILRRHLGTTHEHYRYLADRISCGESGTQQYGTQHVCRRDRK